MIYIKDNLNFIKEDIKNILIKQGRDIDSVKIIAVTKTIDVQRIEESIDYGVKDIGENRVQELKKSIFFSNS